MIVKTDCGTDGELHSTSHTTPAPGFMRDICYILLRGAAEYLQCYIKAVHRLVIITHSFQTAQVVVRFIMFPVLSSSCS